jgi:hypothetical protein
MVARLRTEIEDLEFTVDSQPLVEVLPDGQTDSLSQVTLAESLVNVPLQLNTLERIPNFQVIIL